MLVETQHGSPRVAATKRPVFRLDISSGDSCHAGVDRSIQDTKQPILGPECSSQPDSGIDKGGVDPSIQVNVDGVPRCIESENRQQKCIDFSCASSVGGRTAITASTSSTMTNSYRSAMRSGSSGCSKRSNISFGSVSVHTHNVTLGDNPAVRKGPPLSLEWKSVKSERFNVDEYEQMCKGRPKKALRIPQATREALLRENGHSNDRIKRTSQEIDGIKAARCMTRLDLDPMQEYQVLSQLSLRESRRQSRQEAAAATRLKITQPAQFFARWTKKK
jgi:hypothetical protein